MLLSKTASEGLKHVECEHGIGHKNSHIYYVTKHFLIHVYRAVNILQQMGLDSKFNKAANADLRLDLDIAKDAYSKAKGEHKKKKEDDPYHLVVEAAKMAPDNAWKAWDGAEAKTDVIVAHIFKLYANLLLDEARQPWDKIMKAQTDTIPWDDLKGEVHQSK